MSFTGKKNLQVLQKIRKLVSEKFKNSTPELLDDCISFIALRYIETSTEEFEQFFKEYKAFKKKQDQHYYVCSSNIKTFAGKAYDIYETTAAHFDNSDYHISATDDLNILLTCLKLSDEDKKWITSFYAKKCNLKNLLK